MMRIIRFFFRLIFGSLALGSLLLCCLFSWLNWHARQPQVEHDRLETVMFGKYVRVTSTRQGVEVFAVRRWDWPAATEIRLTSCPAGTSPESFEYYIIEERQLYDGAIGVRTGRYQLYVNASIDPSEEATYAPGVAPLRQNRAGVDPASVTQDDSRLSSSVPVVTITGLKIWPFIVATGVVPLLWLAFFGVIWLVSWRKRANLRVLTAPPPASAQV